jgi:cell cycle checkpoint protein
MSAAVHCGCQSRSPWINPSFDDIGEASEAKRSLDRKTHSSELRNRTSSSGNVKSAAKSAAAADEELWVNKYPPQNVEDLAVHKNKVADLRHWILQALTSDSNRTSSILLITGDAGCGKTAAVKVLAKELQVEIKEWINLDTVTTDLSNDKEWDHRANIFTESQLSKFSSFLHRASRYSSLEMSVSASDSKQVDVRRIILVEDFPNVFVYKPVLLHGVLRQYRLHGLCPLIFVISDCAGRSNEHTLFPKNLQSELGIDSIAFNPIAPTAVLKVLTKIVERESSRSSARRVVPDRDTLLALIKANPGDIRAAINALQFYCEGSSRHVGNRSGFVNKRSATTGGRTVKTAKSSSRSIASDTDLIFAGGKDPVLSLFHAVGKILHCKRESDGGPTDELPLHLSEFRRKSLLVDPEDVVEKAHVASEQFVAFLHQNYIDFQANVDSLVMSSAYISDSDCLTDWSTRPIFQSYCVSIASRGLLFCNPDKADSAVGWKPIHKPQWTTVVRQAADNRAEARDLFASSRLSQLEIDTQLIPYVALIGHGHFSKEADKHFVRNIGRLTGKRTDFQKLSENESLLMSEDNDTVPEIRATSFPINNDATVFDTEECGKVPVEFSDEEVVIEDSD